MSYLVSVMYHYVRNPEETDAPGIHAVREEDFLRQLDIVESKYEVVGLGRVLEFLRGAYSPTRPICCLTFDDGLAEHASFATQALLSRGIQGIFFLPTACTDRECVLPVHQNHLLLGRLAFGDYRSRVLDLLTTEYPSISPDVDLQRVAKTYRWDRPEVAALKFLLNYKLDSQTRTNVLNRIFEDVYGPANEYAATFYLSWSDARRMQQAGMVIAGHTHRHNVLSSISEEQQTEEVEVCLHRLATELGSAETFAFSYPHGKQDTFTDHTKQELQRLGVCCAFTSEVGHNNSFDDPFELKRIDPKDLSPSLREAA